jgi:hypothetical protein
MLIGYPEGFIGYPEARALCNFAALRPQLGQVRGRADDQEPPSHAIAFGSDVARTAPPVNAGGSTDLGRQEVPRATDGDRVCDVARSAKLDSWP